jgi:hypothetical protein
MDAGARVPTEGTLGEAGAVAEGRGEGERLARI